MTRKLPVNSLRISFAILEAVVEHNGAGISDLATTIDRPKSTIYDHVNSLYELEYLDKIDGKYHITSDFLRMGDLDRQNRDLYQAANSELERLAEETGEHVSLTIEEHGQAVIIVTEEGDRAIPVHIFDGIQMNMHTAAPGKAILAHLPPERIDEIVDKHGLIQRTENTITDRAMLDKELDGIRDNGYALDDEERLTGMRSVAAPVIDRNGVVRGSLTIYGPTNRLNDDLFHEELPELLLRAGNIVEVLMNYD